MLKRNDIIGAYVLLEKLGSGAYGDVWKAEKRTKLDSNFFALKFFRPTDDAVDLVSIGKELQVWKSLRGLPHIISVIELDQHDDWVYVVSDFADGGSLERYLRRTIRPAWVAEDGLTGFVPAQGLSEEEAIRITYDILTGLENLHGKGIIHRDLKPDNILLLNGKYCLADFGVSREMKSKSKATGTAGTMEYMPPEAFDNGFSPQTDIWAVGVILQRLLTGELPFPQDNPAALIGAIVRFPPEQMPSSVSHELREIVETCLRKDPDQRFRSARELKVELRKLTKESQSTHVASPDLVQRRDAKTEVLLAENVRSVLETTEKAVVLDVHTTKDDDDLSLDNDRDALTDINYFGSQPSFNRLTIATTKSDDSIATHERVAPAPPKQKSILLWIGAVVAGLVFVALTGGGLFLYLWKMSEAKVDAIQNKNTADIKQPTPEVVKSADTQTNPPTPPKEMVYIPGGEFIMGNNDGKSDAEKPQHRVSVKSFFMDIYEMARDKYDDREIHSDSVGGYPKVGVNWQEADKFCKEIGKRLPTEQEWEFAARGSNGFLYPWGNDWKPGMANTGNPGTASIGRYKGSSPFGVYDMSGNVWEWTSSDFVAYPNGKLPGGFDGRKGLKTLRGGSFESTKEYATTTYRIGWEAEGAKTYEKTGFRCVADLQ